MASAIPGVTTAHRAFLVLIGIAFALQVAGFWSLRHDDAYISFRYSQNLAQGNGLRFNVDEAVMGSTSPGHVLLGAGLYRLLGKDALPTAMSILGCLGWTLQALAVERLLRQPLGRTRGALIGLAVAAGLAGQGDWVALETNLALAGGLWTLALATIEPRRLALAGFVGGAATLLRPDAILWLVFVAIAVARERGREALRDLALFAGLALPGLLVALAMFGGVPHSAEVKAASTTPGAYASAVLQHVGGMLVPVGVAGAIAAWIAAVAGGALLLRGERRLWPLVAVAVVHTGVYTLLAPPHEHHWHVVPTVLVAGICALALLASAPSRAGPVLLSVAIVLLLARSAHAARTHPGDLWFGARDRAYRAAAAYLQGVVAPGDRVLAGEPGTIAYISELPVEDTARLVSGPLGTGERRRHVRWAVMAERYLPRAAALPVARTHWIDLPHWRIAIVHFPDGLPLPARSAIGRRPGDR